MSRLAVFFAEGFEEIEALAVVDICRRCAIETDMVSVYGQKAVKGSHGIAVEMDKTFEQADFQEYDMLVLMDQVDSLYRDGKYIAAICAAPSIFGHKGILRGRRACCYPSFESHLEGAEVTKGPVEISGHVITSRGMGTAVDFGLAIAGVLCGEEKAREMAQTIVYRS